MEHDKAPYTNPTMPLGSHHCSTDLPLASIVHSLIDLHGKLHLLEPTPPPPRKNPRPQLLIPILY